MHERGGVCVVTADHGNADHMLEPDGSPNTAHSLNPVPLIVTARRRRAARRGGILADVAPTVLDAARASRSRPAMTGRSAARVAIAAAAPMSVSRRLLAAFFVGSGVNHFVTPRFYRAIVPPRLQRAPSASSRSAAWPRCSAGSACCCRATRRLAGVGLIALLAAVFPANLYMAREPERFAKIPRWALYARLPLQPLMMWWAWRATRR